MKYVVLAILAPLYVYADRLELPAFAGIRFVSVEPGQTVWQLASVAAGDDTDVRQVMDSILKENGLTGTSDIRPGQVLRLPVAPGRAEQVRTALARQLVD